MIGSMEDAEDAEDAVLQSLQADLGKGVPMDIPKVAVSAIEVIAVARRLGVKLSLDGDGKLVAETKAGPLPASLFDLLKRARDDLVHILKWRDPEQAPFGIKRPLDATEVQWDAALLGLHHFLGGGWSDSALALGWSHPELFNVPARWSQIRLTGVALLVGEWNILSIESGALVVSRPWSPSSQLKFRRQDDLRQLATATKCTPEALPEAGLVAGVVSYMADKVKVSTSDEAAIARFKGAAEALFGQGVEVVRVGPAVEHLAEDTGQRPAAAASLKVQAPRMGERSTFSRVERDLPPARGGADGPLINVAEIVIHNAS